MHLDRRAKIRSVNASCSRAIFLCLLLSWFPYQAFPSLPSCNGVEGSDPPGKSRATKLAGTIRFIKANSSSARPRAAGVVVSRRLNLPQTPYLSGFGRVGGIQLVTENSYCQENQLNWGEANSHLKRRR